MTRLMSVKHTERQVRDRSKTVTRRLGWWTDKNGRRLLVPGDRLTLVRQTQGLRRGEKVTRICDVTVVDVRRERLWYVATLSALEGRREMEREGLPMFTPNEFVGWFSGTMGCSAWDYVTRIEWVYVDAADR